METKALAYGIIGFLLGGLVVSIAATLQDEKRESPAEMSVMRLDYTPERHRII